MSSREVDYLIIGQGLAGSMLALALLEQHQNVAVVTSGVIPTASFAAAGLFNPITGRRMSKTWLANELFPFLNNYYQQQEQTLDELFFYPKPIYRPFVTLEEQNTWIAETAQPDIAYFAEVNPMNHLINDAVCHPYGGMQINHSGYLDVRTFLQAARRRFQQLSIYHEESFDFQKLVIGTNHVTYGVWKAKKILFCDGPHTPANPLFNWLPFRPVKGEVLHLAIDDFLSDYIINQHLFVIPLPDGTYRVGATYNWRNLDWQPTEAARVELLEKLEKLIRRPVHVLDHWAGIRPATADRRPLVGVHPKHTSIGFFGGMGSKGVSLIPYLAQHFTNSLIFQKEIMPEININRYISLYKNN